MGTFRARVRVRNAAGLHARPATMVARMVAKKSAKVRLVELSTGTEAAADSILAMLALGAALGTEFELVAEGEGAEELLQAVVSLFDSGFGEEDG